MRIGVMLRAYDRPGGIGIYSQNIVKHLLQMDPDNHYVLMYNNAKHLGKYTDLENVDEVYIPPANPVVWDQWSVTREMAKWKVDLVFNTKFSVPLPLRAKKIMVLHGGGWFVTPELYGKLDIFYVRRTVPIYCRKADLLISNSECTTQDYIRLLDIPAEKIRTVHLAQGDEFRPVRDTAALEKVRAKYGLPERFILTVTSYDPRKNFNTLLKTFELCRKELNVDLCVVGRHCHRYAEDYDFKTRGLDRVVHFPGWIDQQDLPAIYSLASAFAFPSVYEEFGIPVIEAMACGCPVVSSNTGAIPELCREAALLCAPFDHKAASQCLLEVLTSASTTERYRRRGLERAQHFSWTNAARQTLEVFSKVGCGQVSLTDSAS